MTYKLGPILEKFVNDEVQAGRYHSAEEAVRAGVARLMLDPLPEAIDPEEWEEIRQAIEQADRGEFVDAEEFHREIRVRFGIVD